MILNGAFLTFTCMVAVMSENKLSAHAFTSSELVDSTVSVKHLALVLVFPVDRTSRLTTWLGGDGVNLRIILILS